MNEVLVGPLSAREVLDKANGLFDQAGIDQSLLRKDHNQASEHVFSLRSGQEERGFFRTMADCAIRVFGAENVLSFVVHRDQDQPHAHMLVSPLSGGKYLGSKLHMRDPLKRLKAEFAKSAGVIGFAAVPEGRVRRQKVKDMLAKIIAYLELTNDPLLFHPQWPVILPMIAKDPWPLFQRLNLTSVHLPKTMSQDRLLNGAVSALTLGGTAQNLPSVGFEQTNTSSQSIGTNREDGGEDQIIRVHDVDLFAANFDFESGEFLTSSTAIRRQKCDEDEWVKHSLSNLHKSCD